MLRKSSIHKLSKKWRNEQTLSDVCEMRNSPRSGVLMSSHMQLRTNDHPINSPKSSFLFGSLSQYNHILTRVILNTLNSLSEAASLKGDTEANENAVKEMNLIMCLHGHPTQLFLSCFVIELNQIKNLSVVMRERSVTVRILQFLWESFNISNIIEPFVHFVGNLNGQKCKILTEIEPSKGRERLKQKLMSCLNLFLCAENIPKLMCVLCYRCSRLIEENKNVEKEDGLSAEQWTVGSLIFLRGIVPAITALASSSQMVGNFQKKGAVQVGRLLMKLCCNSRFDPPSCLLNEVIQETLPAFEKFSSEVCAIGATSLHMLNSKLRLNLMEPEVQSEVYGFLTKFGHQINIALKKAFEQEKILPEIKQEPIELFHRFKNELSLLLVGMCPFVYTPRTTESTLKFEHE
jgi:hypothetical protein